MKSIRLFLILAVLCSVTNARTFMPDNTGNVFRGTTGVEKGVAAFEAANYPLALNYLQKPAENGNIDAQYLVGIIYLHGLAGQKNSFAAQKWLTLAANSGHTAAQEMLALLYSNQYEQLYNPIEAYHWFSNVVAAKPQYEQQLQSLRWTLQSKGLLSKTKGLPAPTKVNYHGIDYNALFPYR